MSKNDILNQTAQYLIDSFQNYLKEFGDFTKNAETRFAQADWAGIQGDARERLNLYKEVIPSVAQYIKSEVGQAIYDSSFWANLRPIFTQKILETLNTGIAETFYNSVYCKVFQHQQINREAMFVFDSFSSPKMLPSEPIYQSYTLYPSLEDTLRQIYADYQFEAPYKNLEEDLEKVAFNLKEDILHKYPIDEQARLEVLKSVFYRNKGAYIIGRLQISRKIEPFVLAFLNEEGTISTDALITDENTVSILFSFTRSYFMVQTDAPSTLVEFIQSLIPLKDSAEIYNSIGFNKHGKTEFYRHFTKHLQQSSDKFILAPGIKGMVMSVFTLPSYNVVFKLIKDNFDPPKQSTKTQVKEKYKLVSRHDRVGRLADTHEFENFVFEKSRFSDELLEELLKVAPSIIQIEGDKVTIQHLYIERRMIPLNIYLQKASLAEAREAVEEYGNAIKQLAAANIFPGDMLLKNFGVTRHRRVIFYDYDEICFLTDCNFRTIPEPRTYEEEMSSEPWYHVGVNDIFPEEFRSFLIGRIEVRDIFFEIHAEIFEPKFWQNLQKRIREGEVLDVFPYRQKSRLKK
jgi:isocitrate dehydrogenase kinase/phosphatase